VRIVVLDGYTLNPGDNSWDAVAALGELTVFDRTAPDEILPRAAGAQILLTNKTPLSAGTLEQLPELRFVSVLATGYNIVDVAAARRRGVVVANVPEYGTDSVAQLVFALLLELCHHVAYHNAEVKAGKWAQCRDFAFWDWPLVELAGRKMGIVGFGRIGRRVGRIAHAFGMEVLAADVVQAEPPDYRPFAWMDAADLFAAADVVSLHCPQTPENTGMANRQLLARMKPHAFLINTARGGLIVERDLADALNAGRIAGAAVDVVSAEPIALNNPLLSAKNCIITPHIAWAALAARRRLMAATAENVAAFLAGKPIHVVNP
jgi:glycerate dehydrogenase